MLTQKLSLATNDFGNQGTLVSKKGYFAKNQTKMPVGVTF